MSDIAVRAFERKQYLNSSVTCSNCGAEFTPRRRSAFCNDRCRLVSHRSAGTAAPRALVSVSRPHNSQNRRFFETPTRLDPRIVPDDRSPDMFRLRRSDGSLTDMVNLTRARDALRALAEAS